MIDLIAGFDVRWSFGTIPFALNEAAKITKSLHTTRVRRGFLTNAGKFPLFLPCSTDRVADRAPDDDLPGE
ncbi:hypothetical protein BLX24_26075 [Arsenicibacter rosenii]|uniref:Uncharacterized protein n=1 Tax=Arsenicibacter rosenii TaxID=1750698 RepID=A0A1S2VBT5_9BACT|nr:hypothetical protein BLX24_26075 [Arsenicibacter rosenii]